MQYERSAAILQISQEALARFMDLQNRVRRSYCMNARKIRVNP